MEQAVVILGATNTVNGIRAELAWLREKHPGFKRKLQALSRHEGKYYDVLEVDLGDGRLAKFYFDISDFFGKH